MPKQMVDDDAPRPTTFPETVLAFPDLENFLSLAPGDAKQIPLTPIKEDSFSQDYVTDRPGREQNANGLKNRG